MIDQDTVKNLFHYDAESGMLLWRNGNGRNVKPWQEAKALNGHGYYTVKINGTSYSVHRLIWLYVYGSFPNKYIDHKNKIRNDNRLCNLRDVNTTDNAQNISLPSEKMVKLSITTCQRLYDSHRPHDSTSWHTVSNQHGQEGSKCCQ